LKDKALVWMLVRFQRMRSGLRPKGNRCRSHGGIMGMGVRLPDDEDTAHFTLEFESLQVVNYRCGGQQRTGAPGGVFNATFQAMEYTHLLPPLVRPPSPKVQQRKTRRARTNTSRTKTTGCLGNPVSRKGSVISLLSISAILSIMDVRSNYDVLMTSC